MELPSEEARRARIAERIGAASMCWEPKPSGVFLTEAACMVVENLVTDVEDWIATLTAERDAAREKGVVWGETSGVTWENADQVTKENFALVRLYWYYRMRAVGGPDGSELDDEVEAQATEAAEWFGPILQARYEACDD